MEIWKKGNKHIQQQWDTAFEIMKFESKAHGFVEKEIRTKTFVYLIALGTMIRRRKLTPQRRSLENSWSKRLLSGENQAKERREEAKQQ